MTWEEDLKPFLLQMGRGLFRSAIGLAIFAAFLAAMYGVGRLGFMALGIQPEHVEAVCFLGFVMTLGIVGLSALVFVLGADGDDFDFPDFD